MDAISDPAIDEVVVMKSAQVGWTEILNNVVGYHIDQDPAPMLVIQPTVAMGEAWSKDRLAPMLRDTPALHGRVGDAKARSSNQTLTQKMFPGGHLTIAGANSPASLASRPMRIALLDEVDRYPASAGREGDPVSLVRKRLTTFWNRKTLMGSTPTGRKSRIARAYAASDQRRYWIPCAHCGEMQTLRWEQVRWTGDDAATAAYHCALCGAAWTDPERWSAVLRGAWRASQPFRGIAGFHISELYSPWRRMAQTVGDFLAARGSIEEQMVWKNTALGELWEEAGEAPEWERLIERLEPRAAGIVPNAAIVLTAGVDNQQAPERLEYSVWAWGPGYESWLIDSGAMPGNPAGPEAWDQLAAVMAQDFVREDGARMRVARIGADTGGHATAGVYQQLRRLRDPRIVPLKGRGGLPRGAVVSGPAAVDVTVAGRKIARGLRLWTVYVDVFKAELYRRLWLIRRDDGATPPGWVHLPDWMSVEQVKQLTAEQLVTRADRRGFSTQEWQKQRANEQLDMAVYARAALCVLGSDRFGERFWAKAAKSFPAATPARPAPPIASPIAPLIAPPPAPPPPRATTITVDAPAAAPPTQGRAARLARLSVGAP